MLESDLATHYDETKHTRFEEFHGGRWRCIDCKEMGIYQSLYSEYPPDYADWMD